MLGDARQQHQLQDQPQTVRRQLVRWHLHVRVGVHQVRGTACWHVHGHLYVRLVLRAQPNGASGDAADGGLQAVVQQRPQVQAFCSYDNTHEFKVNI